jgi:tetratricopeptide (TPR) repeat protein
MRGNWDSALAGILQRIENNPDDHLLWLQSAVLYARIGNSDGYRRQCREMLSRFGDSRDPGICEHVARACLLLPGDAAETRLARRSADRGVALAAQEYALIAHCELAEGLAQYRSGEFAEARKTLDRCLARPFLYVVAMGKLLEAMSCFRQGDAGEARRLFDNALRYCDGLPQLSKGQVYYWWDWHDGIAVDLLRQEAAELFGKSVPPT